jgi:hypothetical protein
MLGVADLVRSIQTGASPRASGDLALHVLEVLEACLRSGETQGDVRIISSVEQPNPMEEREAASLLLAE